MKRASFIFESQSQFAFIAEVAVEPPATLRHDGAMFAGPARDPTHFRPDALAVMLWLFDVQCYNTVNTTGPSWRILLLA